MAACKTITSILNKLGDALKCKICGCVSTNPHTVGACGHFSCYDCLLSLKGSQCPDCGQQFYPNELVPDAVAKTVLNEYEVISRLINQALGRKADGISVCNGINEDARVEGVVNEISSVAISDNLSGRDKYDSTVQSLFCRKEKSIINIPINNDNSDLKKENMENHNIYEPIINRRKEVSKTGKENDHTVNLTWSPLNYQKNSEDLGKNFFNLSTDDEDFAGFDSSAISSAFESRTQSACATGALKLLNSNEKAEKNVTSLTATVIEIDKHDENDVLLKFSKIKKGCEQNFVPTIKEKKLVHKKHRSKSDYMSNKKKTVSVVSKCESSDLLVNKSNGSSRKIKKKSYKNDETLVSTGSTNRKTSKSSSDNDINKSCISEDDHNLDNSINKKYIMKRNNKGETPLQVACEKGNIEMVKSLLVKGADPNTKDFAGWTPLHEAVERRNVELVELLLDAGAYVNVPGYYNITPLMDAVLKDDVQIARILLQRGADINIRSRFNYLPMNCAQSEDMKKLLSIYSKNEYKNKTDDITVQMPDITLLLGLDLNKTQTDLFKKFCSRFDVMYANEFRKEISHIVVDDNDGTLICSPSFTVLRAIVNGIAIVSFSWIEKCLEVKSLLKPDEWEISGTKEYPNSKAPFKSRQSTAKLLPKLFDGLNVYLSNYWSRTEKFTKAIATEILRDGGANILHREPDAEADHPDEKTVMFHADIKGEMAFCSHVILFTKGPNDPQLKYKMKHIKTLPTDWILKCIQSFSILDPE